MSCTLSVQSVHHCTGTHELLFYSPNICSRSMCICIFVYVWHLSHTHAALTKCSLLTNIGKITSSSARLFDVLKTDNTMTSYCCWIFVVVLGLIKMLQSITEAQLRSKRSEGITLSNVVIIQLSLAIIRRHEWENRVNFLVKIPIDCWVDWKTRWAITF